MEWIKKRVMDFAQDGSTKRIHCRIRADGYLFYQQQSDYCHTIPFEDQSEGLKQQFARFAQEQPTTGKSTIDDFDEDFEERLRSMSGKEVFLMGVVA